MALDLVIRNGTLVTAGGRLDADIGIRDGLFVSIEPHATLREPAVDVLDAAGLLVLPGLIDGHVHFRQPGLEHEETWLSGTRAAVFGGVTTVLDMPNTIPPTDRVERARDKRRLATASAYCDFGMFGLLGESTDAVEELAESGLVVGLKAFLGPTTGGLAAPNDEAMLSALAVARKAGLRVAFHAEDRATIEAREERLRRAGRTDPQAHLEARPPEAEVAAIDRIGGPLLDTGSAGHVLHLSSADGLAAVERWRVRGVDLTCEVTPHHVLLGRDAYRLGGISRVNPPVRGEPHSSALLAALADGHVDCLASDHAPHVAEDKARPSIWDVPAGFAGVETQLPLMLSAVNDGRLSLERLVHATSEATARTWGLWPRKGSISVGADADLTLVDPDAAGELRADALHGMNNLSPFERWPLRGAPVTTIVRGSVVVRDGELVASPGWGRPV